MPLLPLDKSSDNSGLFPCGREDNSIETKMVSLPADFQCSNCILQLSWRDSFNVYYSCSDIAYPDGIQEHDDQALCIYLILLDRGRLPLWLLYILDVGGLIGIFAVGSYLYKFLWDDIAKFLLSILDKNESINEHSKKLDEEPSSPESSLNLSLQAESYEDSGSPRSDGPASPISEISKEMELAFSTSIQKKVESTQAEDVKDFVKLKESGKRVWNNTHFIFVIDCSGSMKGTRWDSVLVGLSTCLNRIKRMKHVTVSAFTFDSKVNPFCRERSPQQAIINSSQIPFTGKGTDYKRALKYAIALITKAKHSEYLSCIMFLSDGLGGYPAEHIKELNSMREKGKKILFYTIACDTDEEKEMMQMAEEINGEHYKVTNPEAAKIVFTTILNV